jgi:hypothetical protein
MNLEDVLRCTVYKVGKSGSWWCPTPWSQNPENMKSDLLLQKEENTEALGPRRAEQHEGPSSRKGGIWFSILSGPSLEEIAPIHIGLAVISLVTGSRTKLMGKPAKTCLSIIPYCHMSSSLCSNISVMVVKRNSEGDRDGVKRSGFVVRERSFNNFRYLNCV